VGVGLLLSLLLCGGGPVGLNAHGVIHILEGTCMLYPVMYSTLFPCLFYIYIYIIIIEG